MTNEINTRLATLLALRDTATDPDERTALDAAIAALRAQLPPVVHAPYGTADIGGDNSGQNIAVNYGTAIIGRQLEDDEQRRLGWYLHNLARTLERLRLQGIAARLAREGDGVFMPHVYVMPATQNAGEVAYGSAASLQHYFKDTISVLPESLRDAYHPDYVLPDTAITFISASQVGESEDNAPDPTWTLSRSMLATEAMQRHLRLVLRGEPGSGKSTLLFYVAWLLARRGLGQPLSAAQQQSLADWPAYLLPVVLPLRTLAGTLGALAGRDGLLTEPLACIPAVSQALRATMQASDTRGIDDLLDSALQGGTTLVCFDGLDEVPVAGEAGTRAGRQATLQAVRTFAAHYPIRVVVTCRTRAFSDDDAQFLGDSWQVETLAPFTLGQIRHFVPAWYTELVAKGQLSAEQATSYEQELIAALTVNRADAPKLRDMAATPLLLTLMAWVLCDAGRLPRDRPELYEKILDLLLEQWDAVRRQQSIADVIGAGGWNSKRMLPLLDRLSYEAHRDTTSADGRGRIAAMQVQHAVQQHLIAGGMRDDHAAAAVRCIEYIDQRSGLLTPDGRQSYAFAHLTLQEYCAGRHLLRRPDAIAQVMRHRTEDRWHEPIKLGIGVIQQDNPERVTLVLRRLIDRHHDGQAKPRMEWYRDLLLAAEIGTERGWQRLREGYR